ncbi:hypothetical protein D3C85_1680270 [compost metagenome]
MIQVDHQIARRQGRGLRQEVGGSPLAPGPRQTVAQDVRLGNDRHVFGDKAMLDRQDGAQIDVLGRGQNIGPVAHRQDVFQPVVR